MVSLHLKFDFMLRIFRDALLLLLFWIICFDIHRILFSFQHFSKVFQAGFIDWLFTFIYSIRLDLATAAALSALPLIFRTIERNSSFKITSLLFRIVSITLIVILILVQAGETVAYSEWNHKLTSRVFMHLSNPDEVTRTANYGMIFWFILHAVIRLFLFIWIFKKLFKREPNSVSIKGVLLKLFQLPILAFTLSLFFLLMRGGWQPIPLNIDSASFSNKSAVNDLSINSLYYIGKSYLLYNRSEIDAFIPKVNKDLARKTVEKWYAYPKKHDNYFLENSRPNVVFVVLEGWSAEAISAYGSAKGSTPHFDKLISEGYLFDNIYATATTSEIGNSSIFSGNPAIPEVSISMQPEKHRKLHCLNEDMEDWGYHSSYIFSGDLKYGNIGSYFMEHNFKVVKDELDFPSDLPRGKLNFYDRDLYKFLIKEINSNKKPFLQCAFTGSTHSPYDQPTAKRGRPFKGEEADYMNSIVYADECIGEFINKCKKYDWYKNTLFVFVADHGHATPTNVDPGSGKFYHIPLLFYGEPIKKEFRGKKNDKIGSQSDIAATLIYQMKGDISRYPYSKDLMNPKSPEFAFHCIIRGYGWVTKKGNFTYYMEQKSFGDNTFDKKSLKKEQKKCAYFLSTVYQDYKKL